MKNLRAWFKNQLIKGSFIVFLGSGVSSFLNYLCHLITARFLAPYQYGLLQSLIALLYFLGVFTGPLSLSIINLISSTDKSLVWQTTKELEKRLVKVSFLFWIGFLILFPAFKSFLRLESFFLFFIFSGQILFSFLAIIYQATFQATLKFFEFSLLGIAGSLIKIILTFLFVLLGWQVAGALGGLVLSTGGVILLGRFWVFKDWGRKAKLNRRRINIDRHFWRYSFLVLITNLAMVSLYSTDMLLVRHFFSSSQAGVYAAVSVLGKIILFGAAPILSVTFPLFVKDKTNVLKLRRTFLFAILFLVSICISGLVIFRFFPHLVVSLLYRQNYSETALFLPQFALFISLFVIFNLFVQLLLALESQLAAWLASLTAVSQIFLIITYHDSLKMVINNSILSVCLGLPLGLLFVRKEMKKQKR